MPYIPVGAIVAAINIQNTLARQRREEEAKKKRRSRKTNKNRSRQAYVTRNLQKRVSL